VFYELTQTGVEAAREATVELASEAIPPAWVDIDIAHTRLRPTT
jgi:hypothetical protein